MFKERLKNSWHDLCRWLCKVFCRVFFSMRVYGRRNIPLEGPFVLLCNHQSYLDPVFCGISIKPRLYYLARDSLFKNPIFGRLLLSIRVVPIRRGSADLSAIKKVIEKLKAGQPVCLFPEATRTSDGGISALKPGVGLLSRRSDSPVIPAVIDGAFECWPRNKKIFSPGRIVLCFGEPIPSQEVKQLGDEGFAVLLTDTLRKMQTECRVKQGKEPYDYTGD
jgi:1-acyl-sn-glycerol-3-phosphate acyltransferase